MTKNTNSNLNHFIDILNIDAATLQSIINLAKTIKADEKSGTSTVSEILKGKQIAMVFEKPSTRTRVSFESAIYKLGGNAIILDTGNSQLGRGETISDTAKVLSGYVDIIMLRCFQHQSIIDMSSSASVPVINGLTDSSHPCQVMADIMTFEETKGSIEGKKIAWIGDFNNMTTSWIHAAEKFGFELWIACPKEVAPKQLPKNVHVVTDPKEAVKDADLINTDTWVSMGDENEAAKKKMLKNYQVDEQLMSLAHKNAIFMHCLPAHRGEEVTAGVIDGPQSVVWEEAKNRMYIQMAIILWCMGKIESGRIVSSEPFKGATIMVVEDNQSDASVIRKLLDSMGCEVTIVFDGKDAISKVSENEFDVIFMDCLMPIMNGFEATQEIRKLERTKNKHTPIIGISIGSAEADMKRGGQVGMNDFIMKPVGPKRISELLKKWYKKA